MKTPITVKVLITVPSMEHFDACTLALKTIRVGWPTASIDLHINKTHPGGERFYKEIFEKAAKAGLYARFDTENGIHHAEWIRRQVMEPRNGTLVLIDGDTVWWKNCEQWEFPESTLLAGYYMPEIWNDFAKCVSEARIHTSCMVFPNTVKLIEAITRAYPWAYKEHGDYCPCDPFMPAVRFVNGQPRFWDSCANLFQMLAGNDYKKTYLFTPQQLECFDHLNSASFYDVMMARLDDNTGFAIAHDKWVKNPVPGLWRIVNAYYRQKQIQAQINQP